MPKMVIPRKIPFPGIFSFLGASESQCFMEQILSGPRILKRKGWDYVGDGR